MTAPIGAYGAAKRDGERQVLDGAPSIVIRTSWVYAAYGQNFVRTMLRLMAAKSELRVVCDQIGSPTWATSLAQVLWQMLEIDAPAGIYHWCDAGVASWYDFAVAIQEARACDSRAANPFRAVSDPGPAAGVQRARYHSDPRAYGYCGSALAHAAAQNAR